MTLSPPIAHSPPIPGLAFRTYRGEEDLPGMVDVVNTAWPASGFESQESVEGLTAMYRNLTNCDPARDVLIAEVNGRMVAYGRVSWRQTVEGPRTYDLIGLIDPAWKRQGLGTAMLAWNEQRIGEIAAGHDRHPGDVLEAWAGDRDPGGRALLAANGYRPVTYDAAMVRPHLDDIPEVSLPEGFVVREPQPEEMRKVWEADQEAFRDHWGASESSEEGFAAFLANPRNDPSLWRIAWHGDEVAAQVRSYINEEENAAFGRRRGWTEDISTRRPYRRRGLARALLVMSLHALRERGMTSASLGVHTNNPRNALGLYESVGFRVAYTIATYHKPLG